METTAIILMGTLVVDEWERWLVCTLANRSGGSRWEIPDSRVSHAMEKFENPYYNMCPQEWRLLWMTLTLPFPDFTILPSATLVSSSANTCDQKSGEIDPCRVLCCCISAAASTQANVDTSVLQSSHFCERIPVCLSSPPPPEPCWYQILVLPHCFHPDPLVSV